MNKQPNLTGRLLILAAITFWISWFLMPDPGTTGTGHILATVKQSRMSVMSSVIIQIISSVFYVSALFLLAQLSTPQRKATLIGLTLVAIDILGLCSDAFFHLLAYFMTGNSINIQEDVVRVMTFMQTEGVAFLIPLLLPFFVGSIVLAIGLRRQAIISKGPEFTLIAAILIGLAGAIISNKIFRYKGPLLSLSVLGIFATGQALIGYELINASKKRCRLANAGLQILTEGN